MNPSLDRYRCLLVDSDEPMSEGTPPFDGVQCDVLLDQTTRQYPNHLCPTISRRLTAEFATRLAPVPPDLRFRGSRRVVPEQPLERLGWLRWQWAREWPLSPEPVGDAARRATELHLSWDLVISPAALQHPPVGVVVTKTVDAAAVLLLGHVARVPWGDGTRAWMHEFTAPTIIATMPEAPRAGLRRSSGRVAALSQELHAWYFNAVEGTRISAAGRPPATSYEQLERAMRGLVLDYRERFTDGDVTSPWVRLDDLAATAGVSNRTIRRTLGKHGLNFTEFRAAVESRQQV